MSSYYYFPATLPTLLGTMQNPPISYNDFMEKAKCFLNKKDMELLKLALLSSGKDCNDTQLKKSKLLSRYYEWEKTLRNELARLRASKMQIALERDPDFTKIAESAIKVANAAFHASDPLLGELVIENERWAFLEELSVSHHFDTESLIAYSLMLQILERRKCFEEAKGKAVYKTVYQSVLDTADYRDESGETK